MGNRLLFLGIILVGLLSGTLCGQAKVGQKAFKIQPKKLLQTKIKSLDELKGRLVFIEYFAHW